MQTRVTITLSPQLHRSAKRVARAQQTTLSGLIASLLTKTVERPNHGASVVDSMIGCAGLREPAHGVDPLFDHLRSKYLTVDPSVQP